jgi:hypothetical protein
LFPLSAVGNNVAMSAEPTKTDQPKRKRRSFQYSRWTLLFGATICAIYSADSARECGELNGKELRSRKLTTEFAKTQCSSHSRN